MVSTHSGRSCPPGADCSEMCYPLFFYRFDQLVSILQCSPPSENKCLRIGDSLPLMWLFMVGHACLSGETSARPFLLCQVTAFAHLEIFTGSLK